MHASVLVPLDFRFDAYRALPVAESLARRIEARLDVVSLTSPGIDPVHDMAEARVHAHRRRSARSRGDLRSTSPAEQTSPVPRGPWFDRRPPDPPPVAAVASVADIAAASFHST